MSKQVNKLARAIRRRFEASGWSVKKLSDTAGAPYSSVHRFIRGGTSLDLETADKLARALGLELRRSKRKGGD